MWADNAEHVFDEMLADEEAPAQVFGMMDVNGDGVVDKQELIAKLNESMEAVLQPIKERWQASFDMAFQRSNETFSMKIIEILQERPGCVLL